MEDLKVIGVGSPIVDSIADVEEAFLAQVPGDKGGMELVDGDAMAALVAAVPGELVIAPGGSAGNTIFALARLGVACRFLGKIGDDDNGAYFRAAFEERGGDVTALKTALDMRTACCLSVVTPDSERTMRTDLGAASYLATHEVTRDDFQGCRHAHVEGYLAFDADLLRHVVTCAKEAGCAVSLDMASFEVVEAAHDLLEELLSGPIDMAFANAEEAQAFTGHDDPRKALDVLSRRCSVAAVKLGADGALLTADGRTVETPAHKAANVVDTTAAGDLWAAGFLYGSLRQLPLEACGRLAARLGAEAVQQFGSTIPEERWTRFLDDIRAYG
jgi:sugar/nucleoside kinase (ribokinase family)